MASIEFIGGPWDGDRRGWRGDGTPVRILMDKMKVIGRWNEPKIDERPRVGLYVFVRRRDVHPGVMVWQGETDG